MSSDLFQRFQGQVREHGDGVAVVCGAERLSYLELERRAGRIASALRRGSVEKPSLVAVFLPSGVDAVAAILAAMGRGHGYLGIGSDQGKGEVGETLEHCEPEVVVTDTRGSGRLPSGYRGEVVLVEEAGRGDAAGGAVGDLWVEERHAFLGVFLTSGSTGKPKAIVQTHAVVCADLDRAIRDTGIAYGDRLDQRFGLSFSAYLSPLAGALGTGAELHLMPAGCEVSEAQAGWMAESGVTYSTLTPRMWRHVCRGLGAGQKLESVRFLGLSGDRFSQEDVDLLQRHLRADAVVQNALASTEARTYLQSFCAVEKVSEAGLLVMAPVAEKRVSIELGTGGGGDGEGEVVLDTDLRSPGDWPEYRDRPGELGGLGPFHTGDWASRGEDGAIVFLGRRTGFVKVRGARVSLGRTENWLLARQEVAEAVVEAIDRNGDGESILVAFCRVEDGWGAGVASALKRAAEMELPKHQRPDRWEYLGEFPQTHTGKVDRGRMVANFEQQSLGRSAPLPGDDWLREIWERVLGHREFSGESHFFEAGGDSLAAHDLALEMEAVLGRRVPVASIYERPIFAEQAELKAVSWKRNERLLKCLKGGEERGAIFLVPPFHSPTAVFDELVAGLPAGRAVYGIEIGMVDLDECEQPIEKLAGEVRACVEQVGAGGEVVLCGYSIGGLVAWEAARLLVEAGYSPRLFLLDTYRYFSKLEGDERAWVDRRRRHWSRVFDLGWLFLQPGLNSRRHLWEDFVRRRLLGDRFLEAEDEAVDAKREALELLNQSLGFSYVVRPLDCKVLLIRAQRQGLLLNALARDLGWTPVCRGSLEVFQVACSHPELMTGGYALDVAGVVSAKLK